MPDERDGDLTVFIWPAALMPAKVDYEALVALLAEHHEATGGTDRAATFDIIEAATGERTMKGVDPADYENIAAGLLKDTAKYRLGIKKAK